MWKILRSMDPDVVHQVHTGLSKNKRQPYCVNKYAGKSVSASSWGTGRAVSRIPRVQERAAAYKIYTQGREQSAAASSSTSREFQ